MFHPLRFKTVDGKSCEQVLTTHKIRMEGRDQKALAKTTGTTQEHILGTGMRHAIDVFGLVYIQIVLGNQLREGLYPDGVKALLLVHSIILRHFVGQI